MKKIFMFIVLAIFTISCTNSEKKEEKNAIALEGTNWILEEYLSNGKLVTVVDGSKANMTIYMNTVSGSTGVNNYHGSFSFDDDDKDEIEFENIASTKMMSIGIAMEQENSFLNLLDEVDSYSITGDILTLSEDNNPVLIFIQASEKNVDSMNVGIAKNEFLGTTWNLSELSVDGKLRGIIENSKANVIFESEKFGGNGSVNRYFGDYTMEGNNLKMGHVGSTMMMGPEKVSKQEFLFMELLGKVNSYEVVENQLKLLEDGKVTLIFTVSEEVIK